MDFKLQNRICLVTGASSGIGRATAKALAAEGAKVVITARTLDALTPCPVRLPVLAACNRLVAADLADEDAPARLVEQVLTDVDRVDVLVNAASGSRPMAHPDDEAVWTEAIRFNFTAARQLGNRLAPMMAERGWKQIVNVTGAILGKGFNGSAGPRRRPLSTLERVLP